MANISTADGTMRLESLAEVTPQEFWEALDKLTRGSYYGFEIEPSNEKELSFTGSGRWTFQSTLSTLMDAIENCREDATTNNEEAKKAFDVLDKAGFELVVDYNDFEPGCEVAYRETDSITKFANQPIGTASFNEIDSQDFDFNIYTLANVFDYPTEVALDYIYGEVWDWESKDIKKIINEVESLEVDKSDQVLKEDFLSMLNDFYNSAIESENPISIAETVSNELESKAHSVGSSDKETR